MMGAWTMCNNGRSEKNDPTDIITDDDGINLEF